MPMAETSQDLADVFDSSDSPTEEVSVLSDLPSLRRQHATAGYRDGVAAAKGEHVQRGFDRGFPVGAELGIRVGVVLGVLEGLVKALSGGAATAAVADGEQSASLDSVKTLYEAAKKELAIERVFSLETKDRDAERKAAEDVDEDDPCVRLGQVGDTAVTRWEDRGWAYGKCREWLIRSASLPSSRWEEFAQKPKIGILDWTKLKFKKGDINESTDTIAGCKSTISVGLGIITLRTSTKVSSQFLQELDQKIKDREFLSKTPLQRIDGRWAQMLPEKDVTASSNLDLKGERGATRQRLRVCEDARP
ncbi:Essential protein Yae1, N terminal [Microsporum audouinii]